MRGSMNAAATYAVQGSSPLDHFEDGGGLMLESAWSHYQAHFPASATVKQEPSDHEANNDSGISPGRCTTASSSGSDGPSPDRVNPRPNSNPFPPVASVPTQYHTSGRPESNPASHPSSLRVSLSVSPNSPLSQAEQSPNTESAEPNSPPPSQQSQPPATVQSPLSSGSDHGQNSQYYEERNGQENEDPLRRLQMAMERSEMMGAMKTEERSQDGSGSLVLQCVVCDFSTTSRSEFHGHMASHVSSQYEPKGEGLSPDEESDSEEPGVRTPRVNSQGKVKTFRCKQCEFVAVTKLEFWEHSRGHIKAEKLLTCPKCPFVTEYKHHLEYHLRNHFGSKPFKCDKCSYSCVNKSMLNSHLKSHSNVYQYRCADCNYATKYCHSLKLHLRKYGHKPAMVLNPDGSPNPLPIIDVYGTRRGPKLRPKSEDHDVFRMNVQQQQQQTQPSVGTTRTTPPQQQQQHLNPSNPTVQQQFPLFSPFNILSKQGVNGLSLPFPYGPLINGAFPPTQSPIPAFPFVNPALHEETSKKDESTTEHHHQSPLTQQLVNVNNNLTEQEGMKDYLARVITSKQLHIPRYPDYNSQYYAEEVKTPTNPLDLSKPFAFDNPTQCPNNNNNDSKPASNNNNAVSQVTKNRRKGKAYKLERISMKFDQESEEEEEIEAQSPVKMQKLEEEKTQDHVVDCEGKRSDEEVVRSSTDEIVTSPVEESTTVSECYNCTYCDITFKDIVMYTMHMGYHGFQDPFKCNMCGQQTSDRVTFFLHIARSSHC